jgi:hypothetical protein
MTTALTALVHLVVHTYAELAATSGFAAPGDPSR